MSLEKPYGQLFVREITLKMKTQDLVKVGETPLIHHIETKGIRPLVWAQENKDAIHNLLDENGALLIKGLKIISSKQLSLFLQTIFGDELLDYSYRSTPRKELGRKIYTATEYHRSETIPLHNENSYSDEWARHIGFFCMLPSVSGGQTPIADGEKVYQQLPVHIKEKFEQKGVMYVRNYSDIDLPWAEVFQTDCKEQVTEICRKRNIKCSWLEDNRLRTSQINQAIVVHPVSGKKVWFNQAHLFHISRQEQEVQDSLLSTLGYEFLPRNAYYGDGTPIEVEYLDVIRQTYEDVKISFDWQKSDIMLLDNMRFAHGRAPFDGERKVLVGMANACQSDQGS